MFMCRQQSWARFKGGRTNRRRMLNSVRPYVRFKGGNRYLNHPRVILEKLGHIIGFGIRLDRCGERLIRPPFRDQLFGSQRVIPGNFSKYYTNRLDTDVMRSYSSCLEEKGQC